MDATPHIGRLPDLSLSALAARILRRHKATIRVKKPHVAKEKLAIIIDATLKLANKTGFHSMSLRELSERSGLSMGALYAYFDSKETLLSMILETVAEVAEETLAQPPQEFASDPVMSLRWLLTTHIHLTEAMLPWFVFAYLEAKTFPTKARAMAIASERRTEAMIADALSAGRAKGLFAFEDADMTAALIKPMLQDWYVKRGKYRRRGLTPDDYAARVVAFVEAALGLKERDRAAAIPALRSPLRARR